MQAGVNKGGNTNVLHLLRLCRRGRRRKNVVRNRSRISGLHILKQERDGQTLSLSFIISNIRKMSMEDKIQND